MKRLDQLPEITDKALGGLTAGQNLKLRIQKAAVSPAPARRAVPAWVPALSCALVLVLALGVSVPALQKPAAPENLITTQAAGQNTVGNEISLLDLNSGSVDISRSASTPDYRSIWAKGSNGNFPLIGVNGQYYRMMTEPGSIAESLLGASLGAVQEFTTEPSLSGTDVILSNQAAAGTQVYAVTGMNGAFIAAEVNGVSRVFQRVSFNGSATLGRESLADTLQAASHITSMTLSGVGTITDPAACESLYTTLTTQASYESSGSVSGKQSLHITLDNGLTLQLAVKNDKLSACGTWSCPDFIDAFQAAVQ